MLRLLLAIVLSVVSSVSAEPFRGPDLLGLAKTDGAMVARQIDPHSAIGFLGGTFGNAYPNLELIVATNKVDAIREHLIDGTVSNHACGGLVTDLKVLSQRAKNLAAFQSKHPAIKYYVSPVLEHGCTDRRIVLGWFAQLKKDLPNATPVCSYTTGWCPPGIMLEKHGNSVEKNMIAPIRSNDGQSLFDSDSGKYRNMGTEITFGWTNCMNGRVSGEHTPPKPPMQRTNWCTQDDIIQVVRLLRPPEDAPKTSCQTIKAPSISKTNAEYYGLDIDDGRGNKPLLIIPNKYTRLSIQTVQRKEVGCFKYFGTYQGGGQRHYEGNCSSKTPVALMNALGSEWGIVKAPDRTVTTVRKIRDPKLKTATRIRTTKLVPGECWNWNAIRRLGTFH